MDRFRPLFIGRAARPRCFNKRTGNELGFLYFHNKKAWMTSRLIIGIIFQEYLKQLDLYVGRPLFFSSTMLLVIAMTISSFVIPKLFLFLHILHQSYNFSTLESLWHSNIITVESKLPCDLINLMIDAIHTPLPNYKP